jgi:hypothetical protein
MIYQILGTVLVLVLSAIALALLVPEKKQPLYFENLRISNWAKVVNVVLAPLDMLGVGPFRKWNLEEIKAGAVKKTGFADFGGAEYEQTFGQIINAMNEHPYSPLGKVASTQFLNMRLQTRLKVFNYIKEHPAAVETPVQPPIFVMGLPRTGTTFLHRLLSLDPKARAPLAYELFDPVCCTGPAERKVIQKSVQDQMDQVHRIIPHLHTIHETHSMLPEECLLALGIDLPILFCTLFVCLQKEQKVVDWDCEAAYKNYAKQLQVMAHILDEGDSKRWTLKCPLHLAMTRDLRKAFPGARMVWTHRDPTQAVASFASLIRTLQEMHTAEPIDMKKLGSDCLDYCEKSMKRAHEHMSECTDGNHVNVQFKRVVKEPKEVVKEIYAQFGLDYSDEYNARLDAYLEENAKERAKMKKVQNTYHSYSMEDYGIPTEEVKKRFEWYSPTYLKEAKAQ